MAPLEHAQDILADTGDILVKGLSSTRRLTSEEEHALSNMLQAGYAACRQFADIIAADRDTYAVMLPDIDAFLDALRSLPDYRMRRSITSAIANPAEVEKRSAPLQVFANGMRYLKKARHTGLWTAPSAFIAMEQGESARDTLHIANLGLVRVWAKRLANNAEEEADFFSEGNAGLLRAVDSFDSKRKNRFSTHATHWVRQAMSRQRGAMSVIRMPIYSRKILDAYAQCREELTQDDPPSFDEVITAIRNDIDRWGLSQHQLKYMCSSGFRDCMQNGAVRILHTADDAFATSLIDSIPDPDGGCLPDIIHSDTLLHITKLMDIHLAKRERGVLQERFGLLNGTCETLDAIAAKYGVTRERVRQIQKAALAKLRAAVHSSMVAPAEEER